MYSTPACSAYTYIHTYIHILDTKELVLIYIYTDETSKGIVGVVDGALEKVLVKKRDVEVGFNLASVVMSVECKAASMLLHLLHWFHRLKHLGTLVQKL